MAETLYPRHGSGSVLPTVIPPQRPCPGGCVDFGATACLNKRCDAVGLPHDPNDGQRCLCACHEDHVEVSL